MAAPQALQNLRKALESTKLLVNRLESSLKDNSLPALPVDASSPNAIALLASCAALLRAQTTKLSLLVLNKPFTPSEITNILKLLCSNSFPAMVTAVQLTLPQRYTKVLQQYVRSRVSVTLLEFLNLLGEIPYDERGVEKTRGRDTLASTGVIWQSCDSLTELAESGLKFVAAGKAEEYHRLLSDAIEELQEWRSGDVGADVSEKISELTLEDEEKEGEAGEEEDGDDTITAAMKPLADKTIKTLSLIRMLYPPLIKRRIRRFPQVTATSKFDDLPAHAQAERLDLLMLHLQQFSEEADDIAGLLYEHDEQGVTERLQAIEGRSQDCVQKMKATWDGEEDEFTTWTDRWLVKLHEL